MKSLPKRVIREISTDEHLSRYFHRMQREMAQDVVRQLRVLQVIQGEKVLQVINVQRGPDGFVVHVR